MGCMGLLADLRYAARRLRQRPGLLITALVTLALGIGFNSLVFSFVNTFLLKPLPVHEPDRVVSLTFGEKQNPSVSWPNYADIRDRNRAFTDVAGLRIQPLSLSGVAKTSRIWGYEVSGNYFRLLGVSPWRGRFIEGSDDSKTGAHPVVVIGYGCWKRLFGGDEAAIGRTVRLNGQPFTVIGVMPPGFRGTERWYPSDVWAPMSMVPAIEGRDWPFRQDSNMWAVARLKPGVGMEQAAASLRVLASQMAREYPDVNDKFRIGVAPVGLGGATLRPVFGIGTAMLIVAGLTLLVACANLSGLLLAHAAARRKEIAIRYAIGAGRGAVLRMMLAESVLISVGGAALGILTGWMLSGAIEASKPAFDFPIDTRLGLDWRVVAFTTALALASSAFFGLLPALRASRVDVAPAIKSGDSGAPGRRWTLGDVFVGVQVAVSMVLVCGALMMIATLRHTLAKRFGFEPAGAVTLSFDVSMQGYTKDRGLEFQRRLLDRVRAMPGVASAGLADRLPLGIGADNTWVYVEGAPVVPDSRLPSATNYNSGPDFFRSFGARIVEGREFDGRDSASSPRVAVVDQNFVDKLLPAGDPIGRRSRFGSGAPWIQIVGVVERQKHETIGEAPRPGVWVPLAQQYSGSTALVVRSRNADAALLAALRRTVAGMDPDLPVYDAKSLRRHLDVPLTPLKWTTAVLTAMGAVVLFLSALGLYGILSYTTARRTREIGIRVALGAQARHVVTPVLARTGIVTGVAAALGIGASIPVTRLLASLLSGEPAGSSEPLAVAVLAFACFVAAIVPVRRALRIDPAVALRSE